MIIFVSVILAALIIINIILTIKASRNSGVAELTNIRSQIAAILQGQKDAERSLKDEFSINRKENADLTKGLREEVGTQLNLFTKTFSEQLSNLTKSNEDKLEIIRKSFEEKLLSFQAAIDSANKESRKELKENLDGFKKELSESLLSFKNNIRENFSDFNKQQQSQLTASTEKIAEMKTVLESSIKSLQDGNEKKLEEMRNTVDEKLQKTLEVRLTQSFEIVSKNLESVQKGLGEMQQLAIGVGDLKKVLSNVKTRGILGEIQLAAILEQILSTGQYEANVQTRPGSRENVEFAVRLPGRDQETPCYLPIDSKFPSEDYHQLVSAYEHGDQAAIDVARKGVESIIKKCAKDIRDKYINPPHTTDFGVMFLPFEGLYAEVVRNTVLVESLQREYRVIVAGPSTLAALLSSLRLGFNTLAIERQSSEIKKTLMAVKTEFSNFENVLQNAQKKIHGAGEELDKLVGARTRKINQKLRAFTELPEAEAKILLESAEDQE